MSLFRKKNSRYWYYQFNLNGVTYSRSTRTDDHRKALVIEAQAKLTAEMEQSQGVMKGKRNSLSDQMRTLKLGDAIARYMDEHGGHLRSYRDVQRRLDYWYRELGEARYLRDIVQVDINNYRIRRAKEGVQPATVNRELAVFRAFLNYAKAEWNAIDSVPSFRLLREENQRTRVVTLEEEEMIMAELAPNQDVYDFMMFLFDTGARVGEALSLVKSKLHFASGKNGAIEFVARTTKTSKTRFVPMTPRVREMLLRRVAKLELEGVTNKESIWWYKKVDNPLSASTLRYRTEAVFKGLEIKGVGAEKLVRHSLRHSMASRLSGASVSPLIVAMMLGHSSFQMTQHYTHGNINIMDAAIDNIIKK
ncbi:tyrosine-type recombinase/integrase [Chitinibacter tainanensis]|uniref:tyrosine-type recombinase/integrase n=1 Tax=Chitinibacter tainanensis TaxID=230667 RepID=UPI0004230250|nr:site-specific integrase [Chitinibacter tainanensis]